MEFARHRSLQLLLFFLFSYSFFRDWIYEKKSFFPTKNFFYYIRNLKFRQAELSGLLQESRAKCCSTIYNLNFKYFTSLYSNRSKFDFHASKLSEKYFAQTYEIKIICCLIK